jgi:UDP-N-acetylglucosamine--N-acetylmuramyl-(pentapeptide) pyrophosphoryl-undecaprenol N-acetylglucosamine transferase
MGGYSSFPVCIASRMLRIKFITYENNLYIGKTNKYLLPFASKMLVAYSELKGIDNNHIEKIFRIGNILREEILNFNTNVKLNKDTFNVLVLGGSQAAKSLGEKLPKIFENFSKEKIKITIYQQCLVEQKEMLEKFYKNLGFKCEIFNFSNNLSDYFTKTDLVITRSGSSMIAELINCNLPFIAIPLPTSAENHQLINAKYFEEKGYGFCVEEKEIDTRLFQLIKSIHEDRDLLDVIKKKQKNCSDKLVFEKIDKQLDEIINE